MRIKKSSWFRWVTDERRVNTLNPKVRAASTPCSKGCRGSILVGGRGTGGVGTGRNIDMVIVPNHTSTIMRIGTWM